MILAIVALAFILSVWLTRRFSQPGSKLYILGVLNERSLSDRPKPRSGGVAIAITIYVTLAIAVVLYFTESLDKLAWIGMAGLMVTIISFIDDRDTVHPVYRFMVHAAAAFLLIQTGFGLWQIGLPGWVWTLPAMVAGVVSLLYIVWMINLYNFMDGLDGLAAGMAVIGFGTYAIIAAMAGDVSFMLTSAVVAVSAGGFLVFNFPPARIFMGDSGATQLGLFAAAFSLWGAQRGVFPFWATLLIFSPFIVDATATLLRRLLCRQRWWEPHKTHYYQRLVRLGWSHRRVLLWDYVLMTACAVSAIWAVRQTEAVQRWVIGSWLVMYVALIVLVNWREMCANARVRADCKYK